MRIAEGPASGKAEPWRVRICPFPSGHFSAWAGHPASHQAAGRRFLFPDFYFGASCPELHHGSVFTSSLKREGQNKKCLQVF